MTNAEIQVGEYVRFRDGNIRKVIKRNVDNEIILDILWRTGCGVTWVTKTEEKEDITKHSFDIIDLIEAGDYVNGLKVYNIQKAENITTKEKCLAINMQNLGSTILYEKSVKSIVTKEQFKYAEYEVEEDD